MDLIKPVEDAIGIYLTKINLLLGSLNITKRKTKYLF